MGKVSCSIVKLGQLEGDVELYNDMACTQPIEESTEFDFGALQPGTHSSPNSYEVYARNECNYSVTLMVRSLTPDITVNTESSVELTKTLVAVNTVVPMILSAIYRGDATGKITFTVEVKAHSYR